MQSLAGSSRLRRPTDSWPDAVIALALLAVTLWRLWPAVETTPFHRDEARWVHRAYYLREWRDPLGPRWQDTGYPDSRSFDERRRMRAQPPLAPYVLGLGLLLQGRDLATNGFWNMDRDEAWNRARGNLPTPADLRAARRTDVAVGALTVLAVYALGRRLTNRTGAATGALLLAVHPLLLATSTRAWADPVTALLVALAALVAHALARRPSWDRALLLGALLGLGGSAKLSPLLLAVPLGLLGVVLVLRSCRPGADRDVQLGTRLLTVPFVAAAVFVAAYPYLWPAPVAHGRALFAFRADSFALQGRLFDRSAVETRAEAFGRVGDQLGRHFSSGGWAAGELEGRFGFTVGPWAHDLDLLLGLAGGVVLLVLVARTGLSGPPALAAAVLGGQAALIVGAMRVDFARYHLPILLLVAVCAGLAVGAAWDGLHPFLSGRRRRRFTTQGRDALPATAAACEISGGTA